MNNLRKSLSLAVAGAALVWALPVGAANNNCVDRNQKLSVTPADGNYCFCVASLTKNEIRKFRIDPAQVDECLLTTGSLTNPALIPTLDPVAPPDGDPIPPSGDTPTGKRNNGLGNGSDPAPPGIGNAGNDGGDVAAGTVAVTPGSPGGNTTAPGQNN